MPNPSQGEKPGLIENAGGGLRCPLCQSERLTYHGVVVSAPRLYVTVSTEKAVVETPPGELGVDAAVGVFLYCPAMHSTRVNVAFEAGIARVTTDWDSDRAAREPEESKGG